MKGIDLQAYESRFGRNLREEYNGELDRLSEAGLIEINDELLRLTTRGALLSKRSVCGPGVTCQKPDRKGGLLTSP